MAEAGFDPAQAVNLWQNMIAAGGGRQPEWLSTHPDPAIAHPGTAQPGRQPVAGLSAGTGGRPRSQVRLIAVAAPHQTTLFPSPGVLLALPPL